MMNRPVLGWVTIAGSVLAVALLTEAALFLMYRCSHRLTNQGARQALAPAACV